jgi:GntR family transcriptional regulator
MSETVQAPDFSPLYRQVKDLLLQRVMSGVWKPGESLPSEAKLAEQFNVSQGTVRKALEEMVAEHVVVRHQGKGTFVAARGKDSEVHFFSLMAADHGRLPPRVTIDINEVVVEASEKEQKELQIPPGTEVVRIYRVRGVSGTPLFVEKIVLENERFPGFANLVIERTSANTYILMEKEFGIQAVRAEEWLSAVSAKEREASALGLNIGDPLLQIMRVSYGLDGKPIEIRTVRIDSKDCLYLNTLT